MRLIRFLLPLLLAACAGLGGPQTITLGEGDLQRLAERRFPLERRYLEVLDVTVGKPQVKLVAERNRLSTRFDLAVHDRLRGGSWHATLALISALRYEPRDQSVRLKQVEVDGVALESGGSDPQAVRLGVLVAERLLEDMAVYTVPPERLAQLQRAGYEPGGVAVTARGVEVTLAPLRAR